MRHSLIILIAASFLNQPVIIIQRNFTTIPTAIMISKRPNTIPHTHEHLASLQICWLLKMLRVNRSTNLDKDQKNIPYLALLSQRGNCVTTLDKTGLLKRTKLYIVWEIDSSVLSGQLHYITSKAQTIIKAELWYLLRRIQATKFRKMFHILLDLISACRYK